MSVTITLFIEVVDAIKKTKVVSYKLHEGARELYSAVKINTFFNGYKIYFESNDILELEYMSSRISEKQTEEIANLILISKIIDPRRIINLIDNVFAKSEHIQIVLSRSPEYLYRNMKTNELDKIFKYDEWIEIIRYESEEVFINFINFHQNRIKRLIDILLKLKMICQYSSNMNHKLKFEFKIE